VDIRVAVVIAGGVWISMGKLLGIIWVIYVEGDVERFSFFGEVRIKYINDSIYFLLLLWVLEYGMRIIY
jgi:hypothetical protein